MDKSNPVVRGTGAAPQKQTNGNLLLIFLLIGIAVVIGIILSMAITVILAGVIAAFVFSMPTPVPHVPYPAFTVERTSNTGLIVTLQDAGGASSIKGLVIGSPTLEQKTIVDKDTDLYVGQSIAIRDPNLAGTVHLVVTSMVDGKEKVVIDSYV